MNSIVVSAGNTVVRLVVITGSADAWNLIVIADMQAESGRIDVAVAPEEESTEDRLGHDV